MKLAQLVKELEKEKNSAQAKVLQGFFKTKKGEYGEGDIFLGIKVPVQRKLSKKYDLGLGEMQELLNSKIHEHRMCALFVLIRNFENAKKINDKKTQKQIFDFYLENAKKGNINNWDLVDLSAPNIAGEYLLDKDRNVLYKLASSKIIWEKRISILATFTFIKNKQIVDTAKIAKILLKDEHDLIQKAVGWMLREMGKRTSEEELIRFLDKYSKEMPRTMLRYSIERLSEKQKKYYMQK